MARKPATLTFAVDENPAWGMSLLLGLQHIFVLTLSFIFPVVIVTQIGGTTEMAENLVAMAMIATGICTVLQGL
ncbi:MAG TPA: solute carrier family 23 protein, partial [bacterium]|nr:solute carrier family 23 protein [bacterium]